MELRVEDLLRCSNKIESSDLRQCPYDHELTDEAYLSDATVTNISYKVLPTKWRRNPAGIDMERNYAIVTLYTCIQTILVHICIFLRSSPVHDSTAVKHTARTTL